MVLSSESAKSKIKNIPDGKIFNIMFLDVEHLKYYSDQTKLDWAIEVLNNIAMLSKANQLYTNFGAGLKMDIKILSEAIESIYSNIHFNEDQLARYFELQQRIQIFSTIMADWHDMDRYFLPYQMEYFLLGMPFDLTNNNDINEALSKGYSDISIDMVDKRIEISDFIERAKKMILEQVGKMSTELDQTDMIPRMVK